MKGDSTAVFFSDKKLMLEIVGPGPDGVSRVLSGKCLVKTQSAVCPLTVINGQLLWFENGLYAVTKILIGGNAIWVLKTDKSEKDIISQISGPFNFYRIIRDEEQSPSRAD